MIARSSASSSGPAHDYYRIEVELAARLRRASRDERRSGLYNEIYAERLARIPSHPLAVRARYRKGNIVGGDTPRLLERHAFVNVRSVAQAAGATLGDVSTVWPLATRQFVAGPSQSQEVGGGS